MLITPTSYISPEYLSGRGEFQRRAVTKRTEAGVGGAGRNGAGRRRGGWRGARPFLWRCIRGGEGPGRSLVMLIYEERARNLDWNAGTPCREGGRTGSSYRRIRPSRSSTIPTLIFPTLIFLSSPFFRFAFIIFLVGGKKVYILSWNGPYVVPDTSRALPDLAQHAGTNGPRRNTQPA